MASNDIIKEVSHHIDHYFRYKRLEDGFDLSGPLVPILKHPPQKQMTLINVPSLHDRSLKHFFSHPMLRVHLAKLQAVESSDCDKKRQNDVKRLLKQRSYSAGSRLRRFPDPESQLISKQSIRHTKSPTRKSVAGGYPVINATPPSHVSKKEADRILNLATRILLKNENVNLRDTKYRTTSTGTKLQSLPYSYKKVPPTKKQASSTKKKVKQTDDEKPKRPKTALKKEQKAADNRKLEKSSTSQSNRRYSETTCPSSILTQTKFNNDEKDSDEKILNVLLSETCPPADKDDANSKTGSAHSNRKLSQSSSETGSSSTRSSSSSSTPRNSPRGSAKQSPRVTQRNSSPSLSFSNNNNRAPSRSGKLNERIDDNISESSSSWSSQNNNSEPDNRANTRKSDSSRSSSLKSVHQKSEHSHGARSDSSTSSDSTDEFEKSFNQYIPPFSKDKEVFDAPLESNMESTDPILASEESDSPKFSTTTTALASNSGKEAVVNLSDKYRIADGEKEAAPEKENVINKEFSEKDENNSLTEDSSSTEDSDEDSDSSISESEAEEKKADANNPLSFVDYVVTVTTGGMQEAGTSSPIKLYLYGNVGCSSELDLSCSSTNTVPFRSGQTDKFSLKCRKIGELKRIEIGHRSSLEINNWFVDSISVEDYFTKKIYYFTCKEWFSIKSPDARTMRTFQVSAEAPL